VDRLHLPFAALGFSAVVSMMPGFFLFQATSAIVELVSIGLRAPVTLLTSIAAMAMTFGLILPCMVLEHLQEPSPGLGEGPKGQKS
jgi:uncharacterized membrane protein YjjB (DUF3815 family)